jgi:hypothetical protein
MRAIEISGSVDAVALRLGVSRLTMMAMMSGRIEMPQRMFFQLVDIINVPPVQDPGPRREAPEEKPH